MEQLPFRIGNQTAFSTNEPLEPFEFALAHDFDAFEWLPERLGDRGFDFDQLGAEARRDVRRRAQKRAVTMSVHAGGSANPFGPAGHWAIERGMGFAEDVGATRVVVPVDPRRDPESMAQALGPALRSAAQLGLRLVVEHPPEAGPDHMNALFAAWGAEAPVELCFDLGHANLHPETRHDYLSYFDRIDSRVPIGHVHLHENDGRADAHWTLFTGPSAADDGGVRALLQRLRQRGYEGALILEQWPEPPSLLVTARQRLRQMMEEPNTLAEI